MRYKFESAGAGASWRALGLKTANEHSTKSLKIRRCPKDLRVCAPTAPMLTHSLMCLRGFFLQVLHLTLSLH